MFFICPKQSFGQSGKAAFGMSSVLFPLAEGEHPVQSTGDKNVKHFLSGISITCMYISII
jgi:hypothetical protein